MLMRALYYTPNAQYATNTNNTLYSSIMCMNVCHKLHTQLHITLHTFTYRLDQA